MRGKAHILHFSFFVSSLLNQKLGQNPVLLNDSCAEKVAVSVELVAVCLRLIESKARLDLDRQAGHQPDSLALVLPSYTSRLRGFVAMWHCGFL